MLWAGSVCVEGEISKKCSKKSPSLVALQSRPVKDPATSVFTRPRPEGDSGFQQWVASQQFSRRRMQRSVKCSVPLGSFVAVHKTARVHHSAPQHGHWDPSGVCAGAISGNKVTTRPDGDASDSASDDRT